MMADKCLRGSAAQFFVAGELCRRGAVAVVTMGNCPNVDILCSNRDGTRHASIQVKTFVPGRHKCIVGEKAETDCGSKFFWVLAGIPVPPADGEPPVADGAFEYYVIPSAKMAKNVKESHELWLGAPGKDVQPRSADNTIRTVALPPHKSRNGWDITQYRNRWDLIVDVLHEKSQPRESNDVEP